MPPAKETRSALTVERRSELKRFKWIPDIPLTRERRNRSLCAARKKSRAGVESEVTDGDEVLSEASSLTDKEAIGVPQIEPSNATNSIPIEKANALVAGTENDMEEYYESFTGAFDGSVTKASAAIEHSMEEDHNPFASSCDAVPFTVPSQVEEPIPHEPIPGLANIRDTEEACDLFAGSFDAGGVTTHQPIPSHDLFASSFDVVTVTVHSQVEEPIPHESIPSLAIAVDMEEDHDPFAGSFDVGGPTTHESIPSLAIAEDVEEDHDLFDA
ncbi:hypothetical protein ONZ45_g7361 [Pleurotus djamor]|nr:hypothetical protein ONZ45_g7361 [Pleurotus djamor]